VEARINELLARTKRRPKLIVLTAIAVVPIGIIWRGSIFGGWTGHAAHGNGCRHVDHAGYGGLERCRRRARVPMWAVMMAAMMLPSALPVILLVARVSAGIKAQPRVLACGAFTGAICWPGAASAVAATLLHLELTRG